MRALRITIVTGIFPPDIGGPATYVPFIAEELVNDGHQVRIITSAEPEQLNSLTQYKNKIEVLKVNRRGSFIARINALLKAFNNFAADTEIIYANGLFLEIAVCNHFLKKPLLFKIVGDPSWERCVTRGWTELDFESFQNRADTVLAVFSQLTRKAVISRADKIIVPSEYLKSIVSNWSRKAVVKVVPNAVKLPVALAPMTITLPTKLNLVTCSRLVSWKRVDQIIEAVSELKDVGLVIIGEGREYAKLEQLVARLGIQDRVLFTGALNSDDTARYLKSAAALVLNSTYEGYPHVLVEARALGIPVIANDISGTREALRGYQFASLAKIESKKALKQMLESFFIEKFADLKKTANLI